MQPHKLFQLQPTSKWGFFKQTQPLLLLECNTRPKTITQRFRSTLFLQIQFIRCFTLLQAKTQPLLQPQQWFKFQ
jgi:hypothetical protein